MPIDTQRTLVAAVQAALDEIQATPPKKRHSFGAGKALLLGAGLYTVGRVAVKGRGRGMLEAIQQRLPVQDDQDADDDLDEDAPEGEADDDLDEETPEGEADEDFDEGDEPADEADEDSEPVDEADEDSEPADEDAPEPEDQEDADQDGASSSRSTRGRSRTQSRR